jgi:hypothetical protein
MAYRSRTTLKTYFNTGDVPTETQFGDLIDSMSNITAEPYTVYTALGPWNMDLTSSIDVTPDPAQFDEASLCGFLVVVRADTGLWSNWGGTGSPDLQCSYTESTNNFTVYRGAAFDTTDYDNAIANRGYIVSFHLRTAT